MNFTVCSKSSKKFIMLDSRDKRRFTMTYKGSKKNLHIVMKDRKRAVVYTVYPKYTTNKPQIQIFCGEECLLTGNCVNMFIDREIEFVFMGEVRYRLKFTESSQERTAVYNIIDERDKKTIGKVSVIRDTNGNRSFKAEADDDYYRDYMVIFPLCLELGFYKNETNK